MQNHEIINTNCWVAYFDILGFKNRVLDFVRQYGKGHLDIFVKNDYYDILDEAKRRVQQHRKLLDKINYAWFSDTFLFYIPTDSKGHSATVIESLARQFLLSCIWKRSAMRGALSAAEFYVNKKDNIFLGPALIDAYAYAEKQDWIGFVLTPKACSELQKFDLCPPDRGKYVKYDVPIKIKENHGKDGTVIKASTEKLHAFKMHKYQQVENCISQMQQEAKNKYPEDYETKYKSKYKNTLKFIRETNCIS